MTDDEKREQKKTLLFECEEAEVDYEHLKTELFQRREKLRLLEDMLNKAAVLEHHRKPTEEALAKIKPLAGDMRTKLDAESICQLVSDTLTAYDRLAVLRERKAKLRLGL